MEDLLKQMLQVYELMGRQEFSDSIAKMLWNIYNSCIKKGFQHEESMAITLSFAKSQSGK